MTQATGERSHEVVVVGGGFGGLEAVKGLRGASVNVTLVDRRNFYLFQPLLYQVATGALSPGEIASPLRGLLRRQANATVLMAEVVGFDCDQRQVLLGSQANGADGGKLAYDSLIVAAGATHSYFGHDEWESEAPGLKGIDQALEIRRRILLAFEAAEVEPDPERRRAWLTFVVVGGGPTGVELAGQIAEIAHETLRRDFRTIDPSDAVVLLVEAADRLLGAFDARLSDKARTQLAALGVSTRTETTVVGLDAASVTLASKSQPSERVAARTILWAAGTAPSSLASELSQATGATLDRAGRVTVGSDLTLPGHPEVFAIGDMVRVCAPNGEIQALPGTAPPAMQEGRYCAKAIKQRLRGHQPGPFVYNDKGNLATIGRKAAVAEIKGLRLSGLVAWLIWLFVHLLYLVGLENRVIVFLRWTVSFFTHGRGARLITRE